jgi:hypothetical protein
MPRRAAIEQRRTSRTFARNTVDNLDALHLDIRDKVASWMDDMTEVVKDGGDRGKTLGTQSYEQVLQGFDNARQCVEDGKSRFEQLIKSS